MTSASSQPVASQPDFIETCWSCADPIALGQLFCPNCGKIQPPPAEASYFDVFRLPRKLNLDTPSLEREFYRLSRKLHPDVYARADERQRDWSLASSSLLNDAYRTLKQPLHRTEYLLKLEGVAIEDESAASGNKQERAPADLLEEVFELNMQLEEMRLNQKMGEDDPQLRTDLEAAKQNFDSQLANVDADLADLWQQWDISLDADDDQRKLSTRDAMAALLDRRRYIRNLVHDVNEALGNTI